MTKSIPRAARNSLYDQDTAQGGSHPRGAKRIVDIGLFIMNIF